jgi:hypothetical protein
LAALDVALAIGAQFNPDSNADPHLGAVYVSRAMRGAFEGMLANPSLGMVRLFLLLAFYMLGAGQKNATSMYLGVAARAAVHLDLQHTASGEADMRLRTWVSLRIFDILTSFVLGRPQSLSEVSHTLPPLSVPPTKPLVEELLQTKSPVFYAIFSGCQMIEKILLRLRSQTVLHVPTAEGLLGDLRQWVQTLPDAARTFSVANNAALDAAERQNLVGNIHISCVYYFAIMLITRPFLIAYLISRLRGRAPDHLIENPEEATDMSIKNNTVSKLAQVCVGSAIYMVDMCQGAQQAGLSFGNLCLLQYLPSYSFP